MGCLDDRTCRLGKGGRPLLTGNAIYRGDAGLRVRTGRVGREHTRCVNTGAHGMVAPMTAAAIGEDIFTPLLSG